MDTIAEGIAARAGDMRRGLVAGDLSWTWDEVVRLSQGRRVMASERLGRGARHVCILLDNVPEFCFWLGAAALGEVVIVGGNPNHRGEELARDIAHTECQLVVTDSVHLPLLEGLDLGDGVGVASAGNARILLVDSPEYEEQVARAESVADAFATDPPKVDPTSLGYLIFTSGTSGAPKAVRCSQGRMAFIGTVISQMFGLGADDVFYVSMPLFHSNALMAGWAPALAAGGTVALPSKGRFSASGFLPDVRRHGVTYFNYVGKPLSYILATQEEPDDSDTTLRQVFGNEAAAADVGRFSERFGVPVTDGYGSTEGGAALTRTPDTPPGSLGLGVDVIVVDPETGEERARARFDDQGKLLNADEAIGEMVSKSGAAGFEGYWDNEEAERARVRDGWYWTGDLAYRDESGFVYFAGRTDDWLRVDGENFAAAPVARIIDRYSEVVLSAVYAVPDEVTGDQVMVALQLHEGATFDPDDFAAFLASQADLGTKWVPRYVRICNTLPTTATSKILTRTLRAEGLDCADPVFERTRSGYEPREGRISG
jgi:acyl-CoA synthetase (AMP-forming)/AMP-acid ligase II